MSSRFLSLALAGTALGLAPLTAQAQQRVAAPTSSAPAAEASFAGGDVLRHYDPTAEQSIFTSTNGGFVHGPNGYGDLAKATCFEAQPQPIDIQSVTAYMVKDVAAFGIEYDLVIWGGAPGLDGAPGAGPQAEAYRQMFDTANLTATEAPAQAVEHTLTTPLTVDGEFCVGFEWITGTPAGELGIATQAGAETDPPRPFDWEAWDDGSWHNMNEAWGSDVGTMWIDVNYTTKGSAAESAPSSVTELQVAPNPARGAATLTFASAQAQTVAVEVLNLLGQRVASVAPAAVAAGTHSIELPLAGLAAGTYLVRVSGESVAQTQRLVVID